MFLIELRPGIETLYPSLAEFADAIRRGEITEQAKIYHRSKSAWVPITAHPKFREVVATVPTNRRSLEVRRQWTFLPADAREPAGVTPAGPEETSPAVATARVPASQHGWRRMFTGLFRH